MRTDRQLINRIDALLPQTQCAKCGYPGCRPYAKAVAAGAAHHLCAPGRQETADQLALLLNRPLLPLITALPEDTVRKVAFIREAECIGCVKCIRACPVDAIIGAPMQMHTVLTADCTGCDLCVPACPVDCIDMLPLTNQQTDPTAAPKARQRVQARNARLLRAKQQRTAIKIPLLPDNTNNNTAPPSTTADPLTTLRAAAAMMKKQHREALQAMTRAQRAGSTDIAAMQARVDTLQHKAALAQQRLASALAPHENDDN